jgi:hypothetical protein
MDFQELNNDQRREVVNTRQRFEAWRSARQRLDGFRGSMSWADRRGKEYLLRDYYDERSGVRKQKSLGQRSESTELTKTTFDRGKAEAAKVLAERAEILFRRQAPVNRVLGLGRVPLLGARIMRALDDAGLLGRGIRVVGTHAIYAFEAAAGVFVDPSLTTTEDIDLLFDARRALRMTATEDVSERSLMMVLRRVDRSFHRATESFRAENDEGYLVDLIKPMRNPPWRNEPETIGDDDDLLATQIQGLAWQENAPQFEAVAIDEKGDPVRIVATDPRVFAIHKFWLSQRTDRDPVKRRRDAAQASAVGALVARYLTHLPFDSEQLRMVPREVYDAAAHLFRP